MFKLADSNHIVQKGDLLYWDDENELRTVEPITWNACSDIANDPFIKIVLIEGDK